MPATTETLSAFPSRAFTSGWLCFECPTEKRRLAPIPGDWERCDCVKLEELCARAGHVSKTGAQDTIDE